MENIDIFEIIKNKKYNLLKKIIKKNKNINFDIKDKHFNYPIHYLIKYNDLEIINFLLNNVQLRLDILDTDGRNLLYLPIKFNYIKILNSILKYNKSNYGVNIIDRKDKLGLTGLHYCCIFNNLEALKILIFNDSDVMITDNDKSNSFDICFDYERNNILIYLFENIIDLNFLNSTGKNLLQIAFERENHIIIKYLINQKKIFNINNKDTEYGNTIMHTATILNYDLNIIKKLLDLGADINISDFLGNTSLHYAIIEKNINLINLFYDKYNSFNLENMDGNTVLHIYLKNINNTNIENFKNTDEFKILIKLIKNTDLNIQNNNGETCLQILISKNIWEIKEIYELLKNKKLNIFIENNINESVYSYNLNKKKILELTAESYYYFIQKNKNELINKLDKNCISKDIIDLNKIKNKKNCLIKIKKNILERKKSIPDLKNNDIKLDYGVFVNTCYYTGNNLDTIFGLAWLKSRYNNIKLLLSYPLTINNKLEDYYKKIGIYLNWKIDFSNIQIMWSYQKLIFPTNFDELMKNINSNETSFIIIPLGIDISNEKNYSHANILFWNLKKNTVERFEPHGANHPINFNYNSKLLDKLLENKFKQYNENIIYKSPNEYLPIIGFEILENLEEQKCKRIGDPNGFCGLWCIWWCDQKLKNSNLDSSILAEILIKKIKMDNKKFKNLIRNFSVNITELRDNYLEKYDLDINDWITNNYNQEDINNLEKDILQIIDY
jgi:ankyrin repeat protein